MLDSRGILLVELLQRERVEDWVVVRKGFVVRSRGELDRDNATGCRSELVNHHGSWAVLFGHAPLFNLGRVRLHNLDVVDKNIKATRASFLDTRQVRTKVSSYTRGAIKESCT